MEAVKRQFAEKLTREEFEQKLAFTAGSEKNLITRIIPLPLKNGILRIVYEHSNNGSTLVFSNLGPVRVEEPFRRYFEGFRFLLSTTPREPVKATACACGNTLALTFTTEVEDNRLARSVVRRLAKAGRARHRWRQEAIRMKHCRACDVDVATPAVLCPLCRHAPGRAGRTRTARRYIRPAGSRKEYNFVQTPAAAALRRRRGGVHRGKICL